MKYEFIYLIGPVLSDKMFENVDGRTPESLIYY